MSFKIQTPWSIATMNVFIVRYFRFGSFIHEYSVANSSFKMLPKPFFHEKTLTPMEEFGDVYEKGLRFLGSNN